jgi:hypothetical protein
VTQGIRPEASYLEIPWKFIFNKLNIELFTWKNNSNYKKKLKKKTIKRIEIEIDIQNKFYF